MTVLDIAKVVARNMSIEEPDTIISTEEPDFVKLAQFINEAGQELARRVDWTSTRRTQSYLGTGYNAFYDLPDDYSRLIRGYAVKVDGSPVRGGLTGDEWNALEPVGGTPRYFHTIGQQIAFYPYPAGDQTVVLTYQSMNWIEGKQELTTDDDVPLVPRRLMEMGALWRFKRHIGGDYSDYLAEYEQVITDMAGFDDQVRLP